MYMQHEHIVYGALQIYPYLVLYQNVNDNAYSTPLRHEICNVDQKMIILGIDLCYNTFSHLDVQHQYYPEHKYYLSVHFLSMNRFCIYADQRHNCFGAIFQMVLKFLS